MIVWLTGYPISIHNPVMGSHTNILSTFNGSIHDELVVTEELKNQRIGAFKHSIVWVNPTFNSIFALPDYQISVSDSLAKYHQFTIFDITNNQIFFFVLSDFQESDQPLQ